MTEWGAFAGLAAVLTALLLALARLSQSYVTDPPALPPPPVEAIDHDPDENPVGPDPDPGGESADPDDQPADRYFGDHPSNRSPEDGDSAVVEPVEGADPDAGRVGPDAGWDRRDRRPVALEQLDRGRDPVGSMSPGALVANVAFSQGLFGFLLAVGAWLFAVPSGALGLSDPSVGALGTGLALGGGLYAVNEVGAVLAERAGLDPSEHLRELLAPESIRGWVLLLVVALPVVAGVEELLFRAALVGAVATGFGVSPWPLAVASSVAFGLAHGAQGRGGALVAGGLGLVLAAAFVLTGSFLVVFVAHYVVNALEFLVHEGLGVDWTG
ncbi:CPBP family intramembrane metalloprotease domain-containing protein [Halobacteriales archaeon QS_8_69_26]|nr:MAG: CPBP family intramembrane metalloprotease domain-containing protein [Halobacteriales archaeon QS_8_69_26]